MKYEATITDTETGKVQTRHYGRLPPLLEWEFKEFDPSKPQHSLPSLGITILLAEIQPDDEGALPTTAIEDGQKLTVVDVSRLLGVTTQAVYNGMNHPKWQPFNMALVKGVRFRVLRD